VPDSPVDDDFSNTEGKLGGQVIVVITTPTLADGVSGVTGRPIEIERYWIARCDCLTACLANRIAFTEWFYV
jgi:hypothetical protein